MLVGVVMNLKKLTGYVAVFALIAICISIAVFSQPSAQRAQKPSEPRPKKLREIALDRDVEIEGTSESHSEFAKSDDLLKEASAIVHGRIIDSDSFFDKSGDPILEYGEIITTEYSIQVLKVLKDKTSETLPPPNRAQPAPLITPLKIARNGGVVYVNGHRASVKVKGFNSLEVGQRYVFFLFWSPDYKAYILAGGISGVALVNGDLSLRALGASEEIQTRFNSISLNQLVKLTEKYR